MNAPLLGRIAVPNPIDVAEEWLAALGESYLGRIPPDQLGPGGARGWRIAHEAKVLKIVVGHDFPSSMPQVAIERQTVDLRHPNAEPHVEPNGKLCLPRFDIPGDPVRAVKTALAHALRLVRENDARRHVEDFQEDFGLYWRHWKTAAKPAALVLPNSSTESRFGYCVQRGARLYLFPTKGACRTYLDNLAGDHPSRPRRMAFIRIHPLPTPNRYPGSGREVWDLVSSRSPDGLPFLEALTRSGAAVVDVVLFGKAPSGREHYVALRLSPPVLTGLVATRLRRLRPRGGVPGAAFCAALEVERLETERLDVAKSRLPYLDRTTFESKRVVIVGVGALGAGVARLLAQAGVRDIVLVDPDTLGWENIARHEFGADAVGESKAKLLARRLRKMLPEMTRAEGFLMSFNQFVAEHPRLALGADLTVCCTGELGSDLSVEQALTGVLNGTVVYGWMEKHALAAHAVLVPPIGPRFADGFDEDGCFRLSAVQGGRPTPPECGGSTSPFGAVELAQAQSLVARLCVDVLRGKADRATWRTWLADRAALEEADARWSQSWVRERGEPSEWGGTVSGDWLFR